MTFDGLTTISLIKKLNHWQGTASTESMAPLICKEDKIFFKKISLARVRQFDIVAFQGKDDKIFIHRVIKIINSKGKILLQTKGDNASRIDFPPVDEKRFLGRAFLIENRFQRANLDNRFHLIFYFWPRFIPYLSLIKRVAYSKKNRQRIERLF